MYLLRPTTSGTAHALRGGEHAAQSVHGCEMCVMRMIRIMCMMRMMCVMRAFVCECGRGCGSCGRFVREEKRRLRRRREREGA